MWTWSQEQRQWCIKESEWARVKCLCFCLWFSSSFSICSVLLLFATLCAWMQIQNGSEEERGRQQICARVNTSIFGGSFNVLNHLISGKFVQSTTRQSHSKRFIWDLFCWLVCRRLCSMVMSHPPITACSRDSKKTECRWHICANIFFREFPKMWQFFCLLCKWFDYS